MKVNCYYAAITVLQLISSQGEIFQGKGQESPENHNLCSAFCRILTGKFFELKREDNVSRIT